MSTETPSSSGEPAPVAPGAAAQLEAEIAETRDRLAVEVDAIAEKISPAGIKRQLKSSLERRGVALVDLARQHPAATLSLLGLGLALLVWRASANRG